MFIGLDEKICKEHAALLNKILANEYTLYTKTLKFHWNVKGKWFGPLHQLFQKQYEQLLDIADTIAEQVQILGHEAAGSLEEFMALKTIKEETKKVKNDTEMLKLLLSGHEELIDQLRKTLTVMAKTNNYALENVLQDILAKHEKTAWMLRSHLE